MGGKACGCVCPECNGELVAKKGKLMRHHFAHMVMPGDIRKCQESALHHAGKHAAAFLVKGITVPERILTLISERPLLTDKKRYEALEQTLILSPNQSVERLSGAVEPLVRAISPYRPDALLRTGIGDVYVEILVTHSTEEEKILAMKAAGLAVLEIDLSDIDRGSVTMDQITTAVSEDAPRSWISEGMSELAARKRQAFEERCLQLESTEEQRLLSMLQDNEPPMGNRDCFIDRINLRGTSRGIPGLSRFQIEDLKNRSGYWMATIGPIHSVLMCRDFSESALAYLFAWHKRKKGGNLTVLNVQSERIDLETNSDSVLMAIINKVLMRFRSHESFSIHKLHRIDNYPAEYPLDEPITKGVVEGIDGKAFVGFSIPRQLVQTLLLQGDFDLMIDLKSPVQAFTTDRKAAALNQRRPRGGIRDLAIRCIKSGMGEFMLSYGGFHHGKMREERLSIRRGFQVRRGEIWFRVGKMMPVRAYFNEAYLQGKAGVLIKSIPMSEHEFEVRFSPDFIRQLDGWVLREFDAKTHTGQIKEADWKEAFRIEIFKFFGGALVPGKALKSGIEAAIQNSSVKADMGTTVSLHYPDGILEGRISNAEEIYIADEKIAPTLRLSETIAISSFLASIMIRSRDHSLDLNELKDSLVWPHIRHHGEEPRRRLAETLKEEMSIDIDGGRANLQIGQQSWPMIPVIKQHAQDTYATRMTDDGTEIGFYLMDDHAVQFDDTVAAIRNLIGIPNF